METPLKVTNKLQFLVFAQKRYQLDEERALKIWQDVKRKKPNANAKDLAQSAMVLLKKAAKPKDSQKIARQKSCEQIFRNYRRKYSQGNFAGLLDYARIFYHDVLDDEVEGLLQRFFEFDTKANAEQPEKFEFKDCLPPEAEFFLDQFGASVCSWGKQVRHVKSAEFRRWAIGWLVDHGRFSQATLTALIDLADANAALSKKTHDLHVRCVEDKDGNILLDLCNEKWEVVKIMPGKWEVITAPQPLFRRYPHMKPIEIAAEGTRADLDEFLVSMHLKSEDDRKLAAAELGTAWVPGIPHPIITVHGQKGSGKTTFCESNRYIIDPSELLTMSLSRDEQQMAQKLMHNYCPVFDNAHELSQLQSDMLCRASTGEGFSKRQLYTDEGDVVFKYRRNVFLNGLNIPGSQPDLLDRTLSLELERIPKFARKRKAVLDRQLHEIAPKVRRYVLDTLAKALQIRPSVPEVNLPRMADFAYSAEAFLRAMGYPEDTFFAVYDKNIQQQTEEAILGSIVGELVVAFMSDKTNWEGSAGELLSQLSNLAEQMNMDTEGNSFPKRGNALTRKLNTLATDLEEMGIKFESGKVNGARKVFLRRRGAI